jgi:hypothetical protein
MSETAAATKRTYTRRTTRDRVVDLLEQAIELVKARCVDPEKNALVAAAKLAASKREFAQAVELKKQENLATTAVTAAPLATEVPAVTAPLATEVPAVTTPLATAAFTKTTKTAKAATLVPQFTAAAAAPLTAVNSTRKVKKAASCPGGPKAFNEFLKSKRAEVEAELGGKAPYAQVRARIAELWNAVANLAGSLAPLEEVSESKEADEESKTEPELEESKEAEDEAQPTGSYEDLGMVDEGDAAGMRKIRVEGRDLYMVDSNSSLFDRNEEEGDALGEFVGHLRDGKVVEDETPNV